MNKDSSEKLVSIIMPNFNGAKYISESIESIINQSHENWELLIVDDCSTDESETMINSFLSDQRIKLYKNSKNSGSAFTRNHALSKVQGSFVCFLDSDDTWQTNYLQSQLNMITENKADLVFANYFMIDQAGNRIKKVNKFKKTLTYEDNLKFNHIGQLTGFFRRSTAPHLRFDEKLKSIKDDYAFWLDLLSISKKAIGNKEYLASYRYFDNSLTSNKYKLILPHFNLLFKRQKAGVLKSLLYTLNWGIRGILLTKFKN